MLVGQGIDIVSVKRIEKLLKKYNKRFIERIFSHSEIKELEFNRHDKEINFLKFSNRFAAKEAVMKALGTGIRGVGWKDIEVSRERGKAPYITLTGRAKIRAEKMMLTEINLSLSHSKEFAVASVVGESNKGNLI